MQDHPTEVPETAELQLLKFQVEELTRENQFKESEIRKLQQFQPSVSLNSQELAQTLHSNTPQVFYSALPPRLREYNGIDEENLETWISEAEGVLNFEIKNTIYENDPMPLLRNSLREKAKTFLYQQNPDSVNTPEKLFSVLRKHFHSNRDSTELEKEFLACEQSIDESVTNFEQRIRDSARRWNSKLPEKDLVSAFKRGLRNISFRHAVGNSVTMNDAVARAKQKESQEETKKREVKRDKSEKKKNHPKSTVQFSLPVSETPFPPSQQFPQQPWIPNYNFPPFFNPLPFQYAAPTLVPNPPAPEVFFGTSNFPNHSPSQVQHSNKNFLLKQCYYCDKPGHFRRDCLKLKRDQQNSPYPRKNQQRGNPNHLQSKNQHWKRQDNNQSTPELQTPAKTQQSQNSST